MCGRFTAKNPNLVRKAFDEFDLHGPSLPARYNIGPAQLLLTIAAGETQPPAVREMKWGLVPFWDKSEKPKIAPANARSSAVLSNRVFSQPVQKRRCLVPADGFYEWKKLSGNLKEPHHIQLKGGEPFFFAGIFEEAGDNMPPTFAILTTSPNQLMQKLHDRMPVILRGAAARSWLKAGPISPAELAALSAPYASEEMEEWAVSEYVNNWRNEGPQCVAPWSRGELTAERSNGEQLSLF